MFTFGNKDCSHLNGWHETIKFGWITKRYFVCTDCRQLIELNYKKSKKNICPNCHIEMDKVNTPNGEMIQCGICSYGWYTY